jgi:uncharacterized protein YxeA
MNNKIVFFIIIGIVLLMIGVSIYIIYKMNVDPNDDPNDEIPAYADKYNTEEDPQLAIEREKEIAVYATTYYPEVEPSTYVTPDGDVKQTYFIVKGFDDSAQIPESTSVVDEKTYSDKIPEYNALF